MEYILEELLRQRKVLAALMNGGERPGEREEAERYDAAEDTAVSGEETARMSSMTADEGRLAAKKQSAPIGDRDRRGMELPDVPYTESTGTRTIPGGGASRRMGRTAGDGLETRRDMGWPGGADAAGEIRLSAALLWNGGPVAETDARALSRTVQRDARRYDGGFMAR